jgi:hypothetical protein
MVSRIEILQKIYGHVRGDLNVAAFRDWMVGAQLEGEAGGEERAKALLWEIEGYYAEFSDGRVNEQLWKKSLERLAQQERAGTESMVVGSVLVSSQHNSFGGNPTSNSAPFVEQQLVECCAS